jgi:hypothetical protein
LYQLTTVFSFSILKGIQQEPVSLYDLNEEISFGDVCPSLPAGRIPDLNENSDNDGWTLVDFCLEGLTGNGPAIPPDCHNNDDDSSSVMLSFAFDFFGSLYNKIFINNNGNLSFDGIFSTFTSTGFPISGFKMVAPFWADVDTRGIGYVWKKEIGTNTFAVAWDHVGYFSSQTDKTNTFQVMISDGSNEVMGIGNNVCFCFNAMEWTTGEASGGTGGFGGIAATVGVNNGDGILFSEFGRYDSSAVNLLDGFTTCFPVRANSNIPPIPSGFPASGEIDLACDAIVNDMIVAFAAPENDQTTTLSVSGISDGLIVNIIDDATTATATINWIPGGPAVVTLRFTATDSLGASTNVSLVLRAQRCGTPEPTPEPIPEPTPEPTLESEDIGGDDDDDGGGKKSSSSFPSHKYPSSKGGKRTGSTSTSHRGGRGDTLGNAGVAGTGF